MRHNTDEYFDEVGEYITISKNQKVVTNAFNGWIGDCWNSAYCSSLMPGDVNKVYQAEFKILKKTNLSGSASPAIHIGIECAEWACVDGNFADASCNDGGRYFSYSSNGKLYAHTDDAKFGRKWQGAEPYGDDDTILVNLEFCEGAEHGVLSFNKNHSKWLDTKFKVPRDAKMRLAVSLRSASYFEGGQSSLELMSFFATESGTAKAVERDDSKVDVDVVDVDLDYFEKHGAINNVSAQQVTGAVLLDQSSVV